MFNADDADFAGFAAHVRDEPDYMGQLARSAAYLYGHPGTEIIWMGPDWSRWQAIIREPDDGMTVITRRRLAALLDHLESLAGAAAPPVTAGPALPPRGGTGAGR